MLNASSVGHWLSAAVGRVRCSHHLPRSVPARGGWPWRWEGRSPARRRRWRWHTCWWWSASGWPCSEDCFGGLRVEGEGEVKGHTEHPQQEGIFSYFRRSRNLILNKSASRSILRNPLNLSSDLWPRFNLAGVFHEITLPIQTSAAQPFRHTCLSKYMILLPPTVLWIGCFGCPLDPAGLQFPSQDMQNKITHLTSVSWYLSGNRSRHAARILCKHALGWSGNTAVQVLLTLCRHQNTGAFRDSSNAGS